MTVTLPLAMRGIVAGLLLAFARALGEFGATILVAGNIPGRTTTLATGIYGYVQLGQDEQRVPAPRGLRRDRVRRGPRRRDLAPAEADVSLALERVQAPLGPFTLEVDATATARVTAVFGASGAGKTSLLEIVAGLRRPASGRVLLNGRVLDDSGTGVHVPPRLRRVGYVPQDDTLFPHLSVAANLGYARAASPAAASRVADVLELGPLLPRRPAGLSGGERRRVSLGRALLASPEILLLDEPLTGLDAPLKERVLSYLLRVREEFAIPTLYVSHAPDEVFALAGEVLVLERGALARRGAPGDVFALSAEPAYRLRHDGERDPA